MQILRPLPRPIDLEPLMWVCVWGATMWVLTTLQVALVMLLSQSHWFTAWVFQEEGSRVNCQLCYILVVCSE